MTSLAARVRPGEGREVAAALGTAFLVMAAHAQLETARDTLFLTNIPPSRLPWLYLVIAVLAVVGGPILSRPRGERTSRRTLGVMQAAAALGTAAFLLPWNSQRSMFYALYIWGGMAAAVILTRFWLILGNRLTVAQAKRLFPLVASGAVAGSLVGFGGGGVLAARFGPRALLASSAIVFLLSAGVTAAWWWVPVPVEAGGGLGRGTPLPEDGERRAQNLALAVRHPYVRQLALLLLLASVAVTLADFVFKSAVSHAVPGPQLGTFLATAYFAFDLSALVLLLVAVAPAVRWLGAPGALAVRPVCLAIGGAFLALGGAFPAALVLRGVDGSLRWSLHKTASELLYVPLAPRLRGAVKEISDLLAQRGGQALGSLLILGCLAVSDATRWIGGAVVVCAIGWIWLVRALRTPYLRLFRETLNDASADIRLEFPELDMASLETLLAALNSPDEARVRAALDLLGATGRTHVVPALILYHPSPAVVGRALELFAAVGRADVASFAPRLIGHADGAVRAAATRAWAAVQPDAEPLRRAAGAACPIVASTALVASGATVDEVRARWPQEAGGPDDPRPHVARALRDMPRPEFAPLLAELAAGDDINVRREAVLAMGALRDPTHLPLLVELLGVRALRAAAGRTLIAYGDPALERLASVLADADAAYALRVHVPRAIALFGHQRAADTLVQRLCVEPGGMLRYKILRALGRLTTDVSGLRLDPAVLETIVDDHLAKAFPNLHWLAVLSAGAEAEARRRTVGHRLLLELLGQRQTFAVERLFRVLSLRAPDEDFAQLYDSVHSEDESTRAAARELLEQVLPTRRRGAVLALVDEAPASERLASGEAYYTPTDIDYDRLLLELAGHRSDAVAALASYHAVELGLLERERHAFDISTNWFRSWGRGAVAHASAPNSAATDPTGEAPVDDMLGWAAAGAGSR